MNKSNLANTCYTRYEMYTVSQKTSHLCNLL